MCVFLSIEYHPYFRFSWFLQLLFFTSTNVIEGRANQGFSVCAHTGGEWGRRRQNFISWNKKVIIWPYFRTWIINKISYISCVELRGLECCLIFLAGFPSPYNGLVQLVWGQAGSLYKAAQHYTVWLAVARFWASCYCLISCPGFLLCRLHWPLTPVPSSHTLTSSAREPH